MKKTSKIIILYAMLLIAIFAISACGKKERTTTNTETETSTEAEVSTDASGAIIITDPIGFPKPTMLILTVNGEDVYYIENEKEMEKIIDMLKRDRSEEETIKFGAESSVNWMYELDINNGVEPKVYFSEDGAYEIWYGDVYKASTGIVDYLKSIIHAHKKKNEIQWGKISAIILLCIIVLIIVFIICAYRKKKLIAMKKNTEEVSTDGK